MCFNVLEFDLAQTLHFLEPKLIHLTQSGFIVGRNILHDVYWSPWYSITCHCFLKLMFFETYYWQGSYLFIILTFLHVCVKACNDKGMSKKHYLNFDYYIPQLIMLMFVLLSQDIGGHLGWAILLLYSCLYIDAQSITPLVIDCPIDIECFANVGT